MPNTHSMIVASSSIDKTLGGPRFYNVVLPMRWSERLVKGIFHYWLAFLNYVYLLSIASMASFKSLVLQLPLGLMSYLVTFADFCHGCDSNWRCVFSLLGASWFSTLFFLLHGTLKFMGSWTPQDQASTKLEVFVHYQQEVYFYSSWNQTMDTKTQLVQGK